MKRLLTLLCLSILLIACQQPALKNTNTTPTTNQTTVNQNSTPQSSAASAKAPIAYKEYEGYTKDNRNWISVIVTAPVTTAKLIELAKYLHINNPETGYRIFDNEAKIKEFHDWDKNYPNEKTYPYPKSWANTHYIAMINKFYNKPGGKWQLAATEGGIKKFNLQTDVIAELE